MSDFLKKLGVSLPASLTLPSLPTFDLGRFKKKANTEDDDAPAEPASVFEAQVELPPRGSMPSASTSLASHGRAAFALIALLGGTMTAFAMTLGIDGAVVATGTVAVEHNIKKVQHPTGGIVKELHVTEGQYVNGGDVLIRLDDTITRANLGIVMNELVAQRARLARLQAERDSLPKIDFPNDLTMRALSEPDVANVLIGEQTVFDTRAKTRRGQRQQLTERIGQLKDEIKGAEQQLESTKGQTVLARDELADINKLWRKGLVPRTRVSQLEREIMRNDGVAGELVARIAQAQGRISETEVQIMQLDRELSSEVAKDSREAETRIAELQERRSAADDQLKRIELKAPISGHVFQLSVHTIGGVINPGEPAMQIVPDGDRLIIDAKVNPMDIDRVAIGQETMVRLSAFNSHTTPQLVGTVTRIGADLVRDQTTGVSYFTVGVTLADGELKRLRGLRLVPGMPAETFIKTGERTFASYLMRPVVDQFHRALRED